MTEPFSRTGRRAILALAALAVVLSVALSGPVAVAQDAATTAPDTAAAPEVESAPAAAATEEVVAPVADYAAWEKVAQRAEQALEAGRASDQALQTLRAELVKWREVFVAAKAENQVRINTLKTQIATLGPAPAEGSTEPAILTQRRDELTAQLDESQAPVKAAELAFARANALIAELDNSVRARQTDRLFAIGPTPVNPANWAAALSDLSATMKLAWAGVKSSWGTQTQRAELRSNLPVTLLMGVLALVLLVRGRNWVMRAGAGVRARSKGPAQGVWGFLVSIGQVLAPLAGVYALIEALHYAGILGLRSQVMVDALPALGLSFFFARWLGNRVFGQPGAPWRVLNLSPVGAAEGRFEAATLGALLGFSQLVAALAAYETYSLTTRAVLSFPIVAFSGFLLFRMGQLFRNHARAETLAAEDGPSFMTRTTGIGGAILMLVGIGGPLAAAVGYTALADSVVFPTALTVALVSFVLVLHHFFVDLYGMVFRVDSESANEALTPVLASFAVSVLVVPVLALIWGVRVTELSEIWTRIGQGVVLGDTVLSPSDLLTFVVVFGLGFVATRLLQGMLKSTILPKTKIDLGGRNAISSGVGYVGLFLAVLVAVTSAGIDLSSLAIVVGALSVGIGFGLQNIVSNFVSGIILLIERPISEGDWIEVGGHMGHVRDISVRSTRIETFDRTDVVVPNSDLISGVVTNYTRGNLIGRVIVPVGVAYGTDTRRVEEILMDIAQAHPLVTINPAPNVTFTGFGADSLDFEIRAVLRDVNFVLVVRSDINHEIARRFVEEGIEIPFAQRDIWLRNPEVLQSPAPKPAKAPKPKAKPKRKKIATEAVVGNEEKEAEARAQLDIGDLHATDGYGSDGTDD